MFENLSEEKKMEVDVRYKYDKNYVDVKDFSMDQKEYLAVKYGYFYPIEDNIRYEVIKEMIKYDPTRIAIGLELCGTKDEQFDLVTTAMSIADVNIYMKKFPFVLYYYLDVHCEIDKSKYDGEYLYYNSNNNDAFQIKVDKKFYEKMVRYLVETDDIDGKYYQVNIDGELDYIDQNNKHVKPKSFC